MENKKYQIFVSSTFRDLEKERNKVIETILNLGHFPIGMETFGADADDQWDIIKETIDSSDYYLIIVGQRYGTLASDGISYTEKEFDYAFNNGIPIFGYVQHRHVSTTPDKRDQDPVLVNKLTDFVIKVTNGRMCSFWEDMKDLGSVVATNLPKAIRRTPRVGWIKASEANSPEVANELARLSSENSELQARLRKYIDVQSSSYPDFSVSINDGNEEIFVTDFLEGFNPTQISPAIKLSDAPNDIANVVEAADLDKYNNKLPSIEEVEHFNKMLKIYQGSKNGNFLFKLAVKNIGSSKAKDVQIEVILPDFLRFFYEDNPIFSEKPEIHFPELPWDKIRKMKYGDGFEKIIAAYGMIGSTALPPKPIKLPKVRQVFERVRASIENNQKLKIKITDLLQTKIEIINDVFLLPIANGEGDVSVEIICEELSRPCVFKFPVKASIE